MQPRAPGRAELSVQGLLILLFRCFEAGSQQLTLENRRGVG